MTTAISRILVTIATTAAMAAACSAGAASPPVPTGSGSSAGIPAGFPIGSWTTTITEADLRAGGITGSGELVENAGVFTMTLKEDGTWTTAQVASVPLRWPVFRGTWTATGPTTFSQRTTFPTDYAGDVVDFSWRLENGTLVLKVLTPPDPILPIVAETHPWQPAK